MFIFIRFLICLCCHLCAGWVLNQRTCEGIEDPSSYNVYKLQCTYRGPGIYSFEGPSSVKQITMDRLTSESHIRIISSTVTELLITDGTIDDCNYIMVPPTVTVKIGKEICVSSTVAVKHSVSIYNK